MSVHLSTENIQTTISQLNRDFSGRRESPDYDEHKLVHIHRRNRPFVWNRDMQVKLLDSILKGYYIPPIICSSRIVGFAERREVMEGGNRVTTFRKILSEEVRPLTPYERQRVEAHPITVVVMRGLTAQDQRIMFRRLNKNVKVSDGQLYSMSEEDSPLVQEALAFLNDDHYPLREKITMHFFDTRNADNDGKCHLENVIALLSGVIYGVNFITKSYNIQEPKIESQDPIDRSTIVEVLDSILEIFTMADQQHPLQDGRKRRGQWSVGKWLGAILYDILTHIDALQTIQEKWSNYIVAFRRDEEGAEEATKLGGAQNLTATRYKKICTKVDIYLRDRRIATDVELAEIHHDEDDVSEFSEEEA
jgi:hypothetical protein